MANALTGAELYGNNELVEYIPNSLTYNLGTPERSLTTQVVGGGEVSQVATEDYSTAKSMVKFDLKTTSENESRVIGWVQAFDSNVFKVVSRDGVSRVFQGAIIINKPEFDTGSDGVISVEIEASQAVSA